MHIPDGLLSITMIILLWVVSVAVMVVGYFRMNKVFETEDTDKLIPYVGVLAAVIIPYLEGL